MRHGSWRSATSLADRYPGAPTGGNRRPASPVNRGPSALRSEPEDAAPSGMVTARPSPQWECRWCEGKGGLGLKVGRRHPGRRVGGPGPHPPHAGHVPSRGPGDHAVASPSHPLSIAPGAKLPAAGPRRRSGRGDPAALFSPNAPPRADVPVVLQKSDHRFGRPSQAEQALPTVE